MAKLTWLTLSLLSINLISCTSPVSKNIQGAVQANLSSQTTEEWNHSIYNPETMFEEWRKLAQTLTPEDQNELGESICKEILLLSPEHLTIFENELRDPENTKLVKSCKAISLAEINNYYLSEQNLLRDNSDESTEMGPSPKSGQLEVRVKRHDYSRGEVIVGGGLARKEIALTFDDGPSPWFTRSILASLHKVGAKAHFFSLGKNAKNYPSALQKAAMDGHMIGSHTFSHRCIGQFKSCGRANFGKVVSFENGVSEITRGHQAVHDAIGWIDPIFRFPYGAHTPELRNYLKEHGIAEFFWSIDSLDWKAQSPQTLLNNALKELDREDGGVILFHDIQRRTAEMLPQFMEELHRRGYSVVLLESADSEARHNSRILAEPKRATAELF
ncbi:MAG: hypothetical protein RJB66_2769 [Pseudomonadota bacterium]|jgi:peptidoglycan/xylan/chitin deacetylase (PgdA/CDA1 family)